MTEQKIILKSITLAVTLDILHNDFEIIIALFFYFDNKNPKKIQQIVTFTKVANLAKQIIGATADLTIITKKKQSDRGHSRPNKKYFNYRKKGYYAKDCYNFIFHKKKPVEKSTEKTKHAHKRRIRSKPPPPDQQQTTITLM